MEINLPSNLFFDLSDFEHRDIFTDCRFAWDVLPKIEGYVAGLFKSGEIKANCGEDVYLGEGTEVEPGAYIKGPAIIGKNCQIKHVAYVGENVIIGDNCVVGHSCEVQNSIFLNNATAARLNYIGDSILGCDVDVAAGVILANFRLDQATVKVRIGDKPHDSGLLKFGAIIGDGSRIGVNSILNPGTLLGKKSSVYPLASAKGYHPAGSVIK